MVCLCVVVTTTAVNAINDCELSFVVENNILKYFTSSVGKCSLSHSKARVYFWEVLWDWLKCKGSRCSTSLESFLHLQISSVSSSNERCWGFRWLRVNHINWWVGIFTFDERKTPDIHFPFLQSFEQQMIAEWALQSRRTGDGSRKTVIKPEGS